MAGPYKHGHELPCIVNCGEYCDFLKTLFASGEDDSFELISRLLK